MSPYLKPVFVYYGAVNILLFIMMGLDKRKAKQNRWRTPEATLLTIAFLGGGVGGILGARVFHHKTRKTKFRVLFPLAVILHAVIWCLIFKQ